MASRGNYYSELLMDEDTPEPATLTAKKQEKKQKLNSALQDQKKSGKAKQAKQEQQQTHGFEPQVDATRPEKRVFDRHSGTGRGKEVAKQGHKGWGKEDDVKVIEEAKAEALEEPKPETAAPAEAAEEKKEEKKEEQPEKEAPKEPEKKKEHLMSLDQYYNKINAEKIRIEERGPRGTEIQQAELPSEYKLLHDRTDKSHVQETIPIKPAKKAQPKPEQKKAEKSAPKPAEQKKDKKDEKKQKNEPAQKGKKDEKKEQKKEQKKDQKKDQKKEEKKEKKPEPVPEPAADHKKKEKKPEEMTTADFFKGATRSQPPRRPRAPADQNIYHQVWRRENGKEVTEQIKVTQAEEQGARPEQGRGRGRRFDSTAFPELGKGHKEHKPAERKETQAAAPAAAPATN